MKLVPRPDGVLSLEMSVADLPEVADAVRALHGPLRAATCGPATTYDFGGCRFVYQNEWNDPCLVACAADGNPLLEQVVAHVQRRRRSPLWSRAPKLRRDLAHWWRGR